MSVGGGRLPRKAAEPRGWWIARPRGVPASSQPAERPAPPPKLRLSPLPGVRIPSKLWAPWPWLPQAPPPLRVPPAAALLPAPDGFSQPPEVPLPASDSFFFFLFPKVTF